MREGFISADEYRSDQRLSKQRNKATHCYSASDPLMTLKQGAWADINDEPDKRVSFEPDSWEELYIPTAVENDIVKGGCNMVDLEHP
eukprot:7479475-Karenia_brevis.AAC.1